MTGPPLPARCPVHGTALHEGTVSPSYGLPARDPWPFYEAMERDFPYAGVGPLGGCCVPEPRPTWPEPVCDRCVEAAARWRAEGEDVPSG